jgi:hypothetical protein
MEPNKVICEWKPTLRITLVAADGREFYFPMVGIWLAQNLNEASIDGLTRKQCKALWSWLGRTDAPPSRLQVYVNSEDVDRTFGPAKN